jgi:hypothetical protein
MRQILTVLFNQAFLAPSNRGFLFSNSQRFALSCFSGTHYRLSVFLSNSQCSLYPCFSGTVCYRLSSWFALSMLFPALSITGSLFFFKFSTVTVLFLPLEALYLVRFIHFFRHLPLQFFLSNFQRSLYPCP